MADDPIEVEVVLHDPCFDEHPDCCCRVRPVRAGHLPPGSLDEALMRWARAEMARYDLSVSAYTGPNPPDGQDLFTHRRSVDALARVESPLREIALALWRKEHR